MASGPGGSSDGHDAELDELLDSALDDFDKAPAPPAPDPAAASSSASSGAQKPPLLEDCKLFETLFEGDMAAQAKEEWEKAMTELAQEEPELLQHFQKLSEAAGKVGTDTASQQEFTCCLKETLQGLAKNADNLKSSGLAGDDLVKALEGLGLEEGEGGGDDGNILPIMQSIMQNLLSKEVLYPSLKEITTKYPEWLETNKPSLSPEDYQRYEQQAKIMGDICKLFEREGEGAADKESTFERIMDLMQKLQDLGQPPKELAGDAPPGFNFDMDSLNLPGGPGAGSAEQCSIM
ncbi:peroxisomal biogenesis factor 19 [Pundamilia nyererei]|uniref:Peroxisomal biogenesis factor 19 n=2 Tax=Haplochromini TaxID=319058 RepID=A0A3B4F2L8_9CICH|nr:PREDICTED: peroxisomal biogenesis factor 19 [Pundamilia nyererei]XP_005918172.1 peroxisomal biogenesis factor 19 [Haplochromis burtoni]